MNELLSWVVLNGNSVIVWVGAFLLATLTRYALGAIKSQKTKALVNRALDEIGDAVAEVYQTYSAALKSAGSDGKLTPAEARNAKREAIKTAKENIGTKGLKRLTRILGVTALDAWLGTKVEATIAGGRAHPKL